MSNTPLRDRLVKKYISGMSIGLTPTTVPILGQSCKIMSMSGNAWINSLGTANATNGSSYLLATNQSISIMVDSNLSLISDATGATVQIIIYEE